jgi:hypothetical protein
MKLCAVQLKAFALPLSEQMQHPTCRKSDILLVLQLKTQVFCGGLLCLSNKCTIRTVLTISVTSSTDMCFGVYTSSSGSLLL